jgi:hypothetical protein
MSFPCSGERQTGRWDGERQAVIMKHGLAEKQSNNDKNKFKQKVKKPTKRQKIYGQRQRQRQTDRKGRYITLTCGRGCGWEQRELMRTTFPQTKEQMWKIN